jgi:hypothetical protein
MSINRRNQPISIPILEQAPTPDYKCEGDITSNQGQTAQSPVCDKPPGTFINERVIAR